MLIAKAHAVGKTSRPARQSAPANLWLATVHGDKCRARIGMWRNCQRSAAGEPSPARLADTRNRVRRCFGFFGARLPVPHGLCRDVVDRCRDRTGAGLGLILAGTFVWMEHPAGSLGPVTTLLGVVWLAQNWVVGWEGPAWAHSVAMIVAPFITALLLHLVLAAPGGRIIAPGRCDRLRHHRALQRRPGTFPRSVPRPQLLVPLHRQRFPA
jgi:hypothetical protein